MWFGVEHIHALVLLVCDKHEKMSANIWKWTIKREKDSKSKQGTLKGIVMQEKHPKCYLSVQHQLFYVFETFTILGI